VFPARYELNSYIVFRKCLSPQKVKYILVLSIFSTVVILDALFSLTLLDLLEADGSVLLMPKPVISLNPEAFIFSFHSYNLIS
jgi:hypothetical protein